MISQDNSLKPKPMYSNSWQSKLQYFQFITARNKERKISSSTWFQLWNATSGSLVTTVIIQAWSPEAICLLISTHVKSRLRGLLKAVLWLNSTNVWHTCMAQKCQPASDSYPLRGRCIRPLQPQLKPKTPTGDWLVWHQGHSDSQASSYLMPRHPWMISSWPRVKKTGLLRCCDSPCGCVWCQTDWKGKFWSFSF